MMLKIERISKRYGRRKVLLNITLDLADKGVVLIAGPNGAGKTTLFRILSGLTKPSAGRIMMEKADLSERPELIRKEFGIMVQGAGLYSRKTPRAILGLFYLLRNQEASGKEKAVRKAVKEFLIAQPDTRISELSNGEQKKVQIALACMHSPKAVILDEPFTGLDSNAKQELKGIIKRISNSRLVLISTHLLEEIESVADQVVFLNKGRVARQGAIDSVLKRAGMLKVRLSAERPGVIGEISRMSGVLRVENKKDWLYIYHKPGLVNDQILKGIIKAGGDVIQLSSGYGLSEAFAESIAK